jgi:prevent-host-death family protein
MKSIGAFDAKTNLNALLREVERGEVIEITRRGVPVARLVPVENASGNDLQGLVEEIIENRKGLRLGMPLREMIDEGRL